ncbi:glycosyltransferase [Modestobacter muralis]|uniref:Glycosyltransferase n=2 Tax=Modestobacter muralis TaxID=1608614 RepID=A0A6P0H3F2_9ACTN|nr:glycosyltransferase family 2 protein [Modestobacter muralis]NEK93543.1 glycosyltransferase [Modestobacter muralis]NEN50310.1 glycosyltransferase [Modestobacter muralis]
MIAGVDYLVWRWLESVNWSAWWIAVPLALAETFSLIDVFFLGLTVLRIRQRGDAPPAPADATVDVFVTTYDEPVDLVMGTARAALAIRHPHRTWVLDDGAREELREAVQAAGIGYLTRSADWTDRPRHAKAGNLNNALLVTEGEFLLVLDADQVPAPDILTRTLGWFDDPRVALVQTPQWFSNVDDADVLGSQAPLFYGPIQQGKDGWNSAYFCGSNAVVRREALMQLGIVGYVRDVERGVTRALRAAKSVVARARKDAVRQGPAVVAALDAVDVAVDRARTELAAGQPVSEITQRFQQRVDDAGRDVVADDLAQLQADLAEIEALPSGGGHGSTATLTDDVVLTRLAQRDWSPLGALESVKALVTSVEVDRADEAQPVMPLATISVTEDMATAMRLHALGWHTVYHHEVLARGLAPESLGAMLQQRLRWSQGTIQVFLKENPLLQRGLGMGQKLMYLATMWSYLAGFAALAFLAAPALYLLAGVQPVTSYGNDFWVHLVPYLVVSQLLFRAVGHGLPTWRGQQYTLALFPLWIRACTTAVGNVFLGRELGFVVTPKSGGDVGPTWRLIRPQLVAAAVLVLAAGVGVARLQLGLATPEGTYVNLVWVAYDLLVLSILLRAARHRAPLTTERTRT